MGHALVALAIPGCDPVQKVSIIPRGIGALGYTIQRPTEDRFLMGRPRVGRQNGRIDGGGGAARTAHLWRVVDRCADDLAKVTDIARGMVMRYGMDETLGSVSYETPKPSWLGPGTFVPRQSYSETTARAIDDAVRQLVDTAFRRARDVLAANRDLLERAALCLLEKEALDEPQLRSLFDGVRQPPATVTKLQAAS